MFINRPLIHGLANNKMMSALSRPKKDSKGNIRVKTLPSQSEKKIIRNVDIGRKGDDNSSPADSNLIGIKDIKQMIDNDLQHLLTRVCQFQDLTIDEQHKLIKKQQKSTVHNNSQSRQQQEQECMAFEECKQMLEARRQQEKRMYERLNGAVGMRIMEEEERRLELEGVLKGVADEIGRLKLQTTKIEQSINLHRKKSTTRQSLLSQIQFQRNSIQHSNQQLFSSKQQSLTQKNQFIQIQAQQIRILKQIQQQNQQQLQYNQLAQRQESYRRSDKLKRRLRKMKEKNQRDVQIHIKQRIDEMTKINVNIDNLHQQTLQLEVKIHQQIAVIDSLAKRNLQLQHEHKMRSEQEYNVGEKYRRDYQRLFLNKNYHQPNNQLQNEQQPLQQSQYYSSDTNIQQDLRELNHWQNYKTYLQKILRNQNKLSTPTKETQINQQSASTFIITSKATSQRFYSDRQKKTDKKNKSFMRHSTKLRDQHNVGSDQKIKRFVSKTVHPSKRNSSLNRNHPINKQSIISQTSKPRTSLPRLVKMQGNLKDQDKIKNQLTKFTNQKYDEQIELQTVRTQQIDGQQQIIQVEFRGKRQSSSKVNITSNFIQL